MQRHVLSVLVENEPGVLSRVAGLFSGRGFNIDSLNVAPTLEEGVSHMTITTYGDSQILEQIMKQLHKIVTVIKVMDFADMPAIEREMMFVKVQAEGPARSEILRGDLPLQGGGRQLQRDDHRGHRRPRQAGRHPEPAAPLRHQGSGPYRFRGHAPLQKV